jgi:hypothetical protein
MPEQPKVDVECWVVAEYVDEAEVPPQAEYPHAEAIRPQMTPDYVDVGSFPEQTARPAPPGLTQEEQAVLLALVAESKGLGWGVAIASFEAESRKRGMDPVDTHIAIAGLQQKGLVRLEERAVGGSSADGPSLQPVYCVTSEGFTAALHARKRGA